MEHAALDDLYCFSRGEFLVVLTNQHQKIDAPIAGLPFADGKIICNIFNDQDCLTIGTGGLAVVTLIGGEAKIYVPKQDDPGAAERSSMAPLQIPMSLTSFLTIGQWQYLFLGFGIYLIYRFIQGSASERRQYPFMFIKSNNHQKID